jgi:hypothetical protein
MIYDDMKINVPALIVFSSLLIQPTLMADHKIGGSMTVAFKSSSGALFIVEAIFLEDKTIALLTIHHRSSAKSLIDRTGAELKIKEPYSKYQNNPHIIEVGQNGELLSAKKMHLTIADLKLNVKKDPNWLDRTLLDLNSSEKCDCKK